MKIIFCYMSCELRFSGKILNMKKLNSTNTEDLFSPRFSHHHLHSGGHFEKLAELKTDLVKINLFISLAKLRRRGQQLYIVLVILSGAVLCLA